jgi:hypothetical protein
MAEHDLSPALPLEGRETFGVPSSLYVSDIENYLNDKQTMKESDLAGHIPPLQGEGRGKVSINPEFDKNLNSLYVHSTLNQLMKEKVIQQN